MKCADTLRPDSMGGVKAGEARRRWPGAAVVGATAALCLLATSVVGCAASRASKLSPSLRGAAAAQYDSSVELGLGRYEAGEYAIAARHFQDAAARADLLADPRREHAAATAECVAWLRARRLAELARCSERLEPLQRRARHSDLGVNTLIAFGAIAGQRPLPPLKIPSAVRPLVRASAAERR